MLTIWKYEVPAEGRAQIRMKKGAEILSVGVQRIDGVEGVYLWALVNTEVKGNVWRTIYVRGTGHPFVQPGDLGDPISCPFIGTIFLRSGAVFHLFDGGEG